ncbi:MAG: AtpZ/AtpI family protein [Bacteroidota bacterium]|nr:AtpZ/AtpI family protein [Bacteroidota bacterium]
MSETDGGDKLKKGKKALNSYATISSLILQLVALIVLGGWGGKELDRWLHLSFPLFTLLFILVTACLGFYYLVRTMLKK